MISTKCQACGLNKRNNHFRNSESICDDCVAANDNSEYCEPCAKLDASLVDAIEQIDETWVCKRCAFAIRFMKERERIEIEIFIRSGKCHF